MLHRKTHSGKAAPFPARTRATIPIYGYRPKLLALVAGGVLFASISGCKKDDEICGIKSGGGIQASNQKNIMFWIDHDMKLGKLKVDRLMNRKTGLAESSRGEWIMTRYFNSQPECGTNGAATFLLTKGYEYDYYVYGETGDTLTGTISVDCSADCQAFLIQ